jgi:hypothetical protein
MNVRDSTRLAAGGNACKPGGSIHKTCGRVFCRSELARDEPENAAGYQVSRVIVDDHREQARSYSDLCIRARWRPRVGSRRYGRRGLRVGGW